MNQRAGYKDRFPELYEFFGGYFYGTAIDDHDSFEEFLEHAFTDFISGSPKEDKKSLVLEIQQIQRADFSSRELSKLLQECGSDFGFKDKGVLIILEELKSRLQSSLDKDKKNK